MTSDKLRMTLDELRMTLDELRMTLDELAPATRPIKKERRLGQIKADSVHMRPK